MKWLSVFVLSTVTSALVSFSVIYVSSTTSFFDDLLSKNALVTVPHMVGLDERAALANMKDIGLLLSIDKRQPKEGVKDGTVIAQSIDAGVGLARGATVKVVLAAAMPIVPNLSGMTLEEARTALKNSRLSVLEGPPVANNLIVEGLIAGQKPKGGSSVVAGSSIEVYISSGPDFASVPKLVNMTLVKAKERLVQEGFKPAVRWVDLAETRSNVVLKQAPKANTQLTLGETVEITVNRP